MSLNSKFETYYLDFPTIIAFSVISDNYLENAKRTDISLNLFWYKVFLHLKLKLLGFRLSFFEKIYVEKRSSSVPANIPH